MSDTVLPELPADRGKLLERIRASLARVTALRETMRMNPARAADVRTVRAWQAQRLARTYADLLADPRYHAAAAFFLSDLYGTKDFSQRDAEMARILPKLASVLPLGAVQSLALAVDLHALSEELDAKLADALRGQQADGPLCIDEQRYVRAYRACDERAARAAQIELVDAVGRLLDQVAHRPLVERTIQLMRKPAQLAGLAALHAFLERGLQAFRQMGGADRFLATVRAREAVILDRLLAGHPEPFAPAGPSGSESDDGS